MTAMRHAHDKTMTIQAATAYVQDKAEMHPKNLNNNTSSAASHRTS
jgi:hypothetical protein